MEHRSPRLRLVKLAVEAGLERAAEIAALARPGFRLVANRAAGSPGGASKLGSVPGLPANLEWPCG